MVFIPLAFAAVTATAQTHITALHRTLKIYRDYYASAPGDTVAGSESAQACSHIVFLDWVNLYRPSQDDLMYGDVQDLTKLQVDAGDDLQKVFEFYRPGLSDAIRAKLNSMRAQKRAFAPTDQAANLLAQLKLCKAPEVITEVTQNLPPSAKSAVQTSRPIIEFVQDGHPEIRTEDHDYPGWLTFIKQRVSGEVRVLPTE